jgi:DNA invertase Pin-like site-specific DNA recombinase
MFVRAYLRASTEDQDASRARKQLEADWERLKAEIAARRVRGVALDLPTSWTLASAGSDDFTARMLDALNGMMLDVLAAVARKGLRGSSTASGAGASESEG